MKPIAILGMIFSWLLFGCAPGKPDLNQILTNGAQVKAGGESVTIHIHQLGKTEFSSGRVAPKDTMMLDVEAELDRSVPTTEGLAEAVVARFESGDERVAFLRVRFKAEPAARYAPALRKIGPEWHESYREAYPVDSGFGGFVDYTLQKEINELLGAENSELTKRLHRDLEQQSKPTWSWANFEVKPGIKILVVSSGFGDGGYKTYYGLNSKNELVSLLTDFEVLESVISEAE